MDDNSECMTLRALFKAITYPDSGHHGLWYDVIAPWIERNRGVSFIPEIFRRRCAAEPRQLEQAYVLSRINDRLIMPFQADFPTISRKARKAYQGSGLTLAQYEDFLVAMGMTPFIDRPFSPYYHEVVEMEEVVGLPHSVLITNILWPRSIYGDMLFSRAGVKIQCRPGLFNKDLIEHSTLHFAYQRLRREAHDMSHGWGSNSQWRTTFYRNYEDDQAFYYNVDGEWTIGAEKDGPHMRWLPDRISISEEERIEILTYRCRVTKSGEDDLPYFDRHVEMRRSSL